MPTNFNILRGNTATIANKSLTEGLMTIDTDKKKVSVDWNSNGTLERIGFSSGDVTANSNESGSNDLEGLLVGEKGYKVLPIDSDLVLSENDITLSDIIDNKADIDDYGVDLIAKRVMTNLTAPTKNTDSYVYRKVPTAKTDIVDMHKIVGASVVWNQLIKNGNFATLGNWKGGTNTNVSVSNNTLSATPKDESVSGNRFIYNSLDFFTLYSTHKYLIKSFATSTGSIKYQLAQNTPYSTLGTVTLDCSTTKTLVCCIMSPSSDTLSGRVNVVFDGRDYLNIEDLQVIDLTAMFGTTVADYVYSLEQSESGTGIAWLQSYGFFTENYYAYQTNKIESVCVSEKKIGGKNLFNNDIIYGDRYNGVYHQGNSYWTCRNLIPILPNTTYTFSGLTNDGQIGFYNENQTYISNIDVSATVTFTTPSNAKYISVYNAIASMEYNHQLELGSIATSYQPYSEPSTYPISPITLRGLFGVNNGKLTVDGDEYNADGNVTRKYGTITLNGTQPLRSVNWRPTENGVGVLYYYDTTNNKVVENNVLSNAISDKLQSQTYYDIYSSGKVGFCFYNTTALGLILYLPDTSLTTESAVNTYLSNNPITITYELATPTTEQTTPFVEIQNDNASVSGNPVTINAERGVMQNAIVTLEPIQDLHGYDSPWYGGAEKNKLPVTATSEEIDGITYTVASDGKITANGTATANSNFYVMGSDFIKLPTGEYTLNGCPSGGGTDSYSIRFEINGEYGGRDAGSGKSFELTNTDELKIYIRIAHGTQVNNMVFAPMVRPSSVADETFAPYANICPISGRTQTIVSVNSEDTTIQFGQTIYAGEVNVTSGILKITHAITHITNVSLSNNQFYAPSPTGMIKMPGNYTVAEVRSNLFPTVASYGLVTNNALGVTGYNDTQGRYPNQNWIYFGNGDPNITTQNQMKTWLQNNPLYVCYKLATPIEVPLTANEISLNQGTNTVTVNDNGTISFDYRMIDTFISTEEFVDYGVNQGNRDIAIPVGHDSDYYQCFDLPELPTDSNVYLLTCTVTNGEPNITWERS